MPNTSCKNCTKRTIGCHSTCQEYLAYKQELNKQREEEKKSKGYSPHYRKYYKTKSINFGKNGNMRDE